MKTPTKAELYAQIEALTRENNKLQEQLDAVKRERWERHKGKAKRIFYEHVPFTVLQVRKLMLDHIDDSGYWFSFNVDKDETRQTYCVRHADLEDLYE
jgi:hypothetical protein